MASASAKRSSAESSEVTSSYSSSLPDGTASHSEVEGLSEADVSPLAASVQSLDSLSGDAVLASTTDPLLWSTTVDPESEVPVPVP